MFLDSLFCSSYDCLRDSLWLLQAVENLVVVVFHYRFLKNPPVRDRGCSWQVEFAGLVPFSFFHIFFFTTSQSHRVKLCFFLELWKRSQETDQYYWWEKTTEKRDQDEKWTCLKNCGSLCVWQFCLIDTEVIWSTPKSVSQLHFQCKSSLWSVSFPRGTVVSITNCIPCSLEPRLDIESSKKTS